MPEVFGQHERSNAPSESIEPGMYDATIESVRLVRNADGTPKVTENDKEQADVKFLTSEGVVSRRYSISFGQNRSTGQYALFAKFIEAATGVKCGDSAQRKVTDSDLAGKSVRIVTDINERGYANVTSVLAPKNTPRTEPNPDANPFDGEEEVPF